MRIKAALIDVIDCSSMASYVNANPVSALWCCKNSAALPVDEFLICPATRSRRVEIEDVQ